MSGCGRRLRKLKKTSKGPRRLTVSSVSGYSRACKAFQSHVEVRLDFGSPKSPSVWPQPISSHHTYLTRLLVTHTLAQHLQGVSKQQRAAGKKEQLLARHGQDSHS